MSILTMNNLDVNGCVLVYVNYVMYVTNIIRGFLCLSQEWEHPNLDFGWIPACRGQWFRNVRWRQPQIAARMTVRSCHGMASLKMVCK